jgi:hypothetical protein
MDDKESKTLQAVIKDISYSADSAIPDNGKLTYAVLTNQPFWRFNTKIKIIPRQTFRGCQNGTLVCWLFVIDNYFS